MEPREDALAGAADVGKRPKLARGPVTQRFAARPAPLPCYVGRFHWLLRRSACPLARQRIACEASRGGASRGPAECHVQGRAPGGRRGRWGPGLSQPTARGAGLSSGCSLFPLSLITPFIHSLHLALTERLQGAGPWGFMEMEPPGQRECLRPQPSGQCVVIRATSDSFGLWEHRARSLSGRCLGVLEASRSMQRRQPAST